MVIAAPVVVVAVKTKSPLLEDNLGKLTDDDDDDDPTVPSREGKETHMVKFHYFSLE